MDSIDAWDAKALESVCQQAETREAALGYMRVLRRLSMSLPPLAVYHCAYIASEKLQNADVLYKKLKELGIARGGPFWKDLEHVQDLLSAASVNSANEGAGRRIAFTYGRLPEHESACDGCRARRLPCLQSRRTSATDPRNRGTYKCQVCFWGLVKCTRSGSAAGGGRAERSRAEVIDLTLEYPTTDDEESDVVEYLTPEPRVRPSSESAGQNTRDQEPMRSAGGDTQSDSTHAESNTSPQRAPSPLAQQPVLHATAPNVPGPDFYMFGSERTQPPGISRLNGLSLQQSNHHAAALRPPARPGASSASQPQSDAERQARYVVVAYNKAREFIERVDEYRRLNIKSLEAATDMENALQALGSPEAL